MFFLRMTCSNKIKDLISNEKILQYYKIIRSKAISVSKSL